MPGKLIFITGGIRSGKSTFAEQVTSRLGSDITYLATARAFDEETRHRIDLHRQRRPENWTTVEEPLNVTSVINEVGSTTDAILLDCLTMLITNQIFARAESDDPANSCQEPDLSRERQSEIIEEIKRLAETAKNVPANVIIVSNEVGMTLVSDNFLGRQYQELVGRANQVVAALADEAYLVVAGCPIDLKKGVNQ